MDDMFRNRKELLFADVILSKYDTLADMQAAQALRQTSPALCLETCYLLKLYHVISNELSMRFENTLKLLNLNEFR